MNELQHAYNDFADARELQNQRWFDIACEVRGAEFTLEKQANWWAEVNLDVVKARLLSGFRK